MQGADPGASQLSRLQAGGSPARSHSGVTAPLLTDHGQCLGSLISATGYPKGGRCPVALGSDESMELAAAPRCPVPLAPSSGSPWLNTLLAEWRARPLSLRTKPGLHLQ